MKHFLVLCSVIFALTLFSCSNTSSSSTSGFSINPGTLIAPSPAAVACSFSGVQIGPKPYSPNSYCFAVVYQSTTQTGIALGIYDPTPGPTQGLEIAKIMFYVNDGTPLPTVPGTVTYNTTGGIVAKYAFDGTNPSTTPRNTALVKRSATGNVHFSITYVANNNYNIAVLALPTTTPTVTVSSINQAVKAQ